ncbi:B-cell cll/lymphoma 6 member b protein, partial [Biomphalaria glabrata]
ENLHVTNMSRIPKWLFQKDWLCYQDVVKLLENSPSCLEYALAQDCSEEIRNIYKFICTFSPEICHMECKEYRFEEIARHKMRTHLKEHINILKSEENHHDFRTKNQLFKGNKNIQKHKSSLVVNKEISPKKVKMSRKEVSLELSTKTKGLKIYKSKFTKLKVPNKTTMPSVKFEEITQSVDNQFEESFAPCHNQKSEANTTAQEEFKLKEENLFDEELEENDRKNCETQTLYTGKEQETFQYKIATKLFAVDRSQWSTIEKVLDDIVSSESPDENLSQDDREKILVGMKQWMDSVQIYDHQTVSRLQDPLTQAEKTVLESLTTEDWRKLEASHDSESKLRLTVYARMLLRDYECFPRKLKPKYCQHCGKNYTASTSLYSHLVSLSGIRFWVCSKCKDSNMEDATFTRKHSLQYHILKEVGIPRYRCTQPGCNKTHNHTHHQKSHARQHTGEKHYICVIEGCNGRFSNRNTYSRHLLQFHSVELTRNNQLQEIDEKEARLKVYAARLKARERSKCKRLHNNDIVKVPLKSDVLPRKVTIDENILTAAQHFLTEVQLEEDKKNDSTENDTQLNLEKLMRPSASKLLYGIAKDVRNTTCSIEEAKPENNLGGLNLLATVSKYMNFKTCPKEEQEPSEKRDVCSLNTSTSTYLNVKEEMKENNSKELNTMYNCSVLNNDIVQINTTEEEVSLGGCANLASNYNQGENSTQIFPTNMEDHSIVNSSIRRVSACKTLPNPNAEVFNFNTSPFFPSETSNSFSDFKGTISLLAYDSSPMSASSNCSKVQQESNPSQSRVSTMAANVDINTSKSVVGIDTSVNLVTQNNLEMKNSMNGVNSFSGKIKAKPKGGLNTELLNNNYCSNDSIAKSSQIINISKTDVPLQFKSMTTLSGKTYIVLSSSGKQYKLRQPSVSATSTINSETSSRVLPFSEL